MQKRKMKMAKMKKKMYAKGGAVNKMKKMAKGGAVNKVMKMSKGGAVNKVKKMGDPKIIKGPYS